VCVFVFVYMQFYGNVVVGRRGGGGVVGVSVHVFMCVIEPGPACVVEPGPTCVIEPGPTCVIEPGPT
jgi:hypothetical protein